MIDLNGHLHDAQTTETLGQALASLRPASAVVQLHGDLGAGKSTLARALLRALGVTGPIRSPTYTLVERYPLSTGDEAWHLDLYRIGTPGNWIFSGSTKAVRACAGGMAGARRWCAAAGRSERGTGRCRRRPQRSVAGPQRGRQRLAGASVAAAPVAGLFCRLTRRMNARLWIIKGNHLAIHTVG